MPLIKERPDIRLRIPPQIAPGEEVTAEVLLDSKSGVEVEWIDVEIEGFEGWRYKSGKTTYSDSIGVTRLVARVSGERELPVGRTRLPVRFTLPADASPTYRGWAVYTYYTVNVRASIDWWPDAKASFAVRVVEPPLPAPPRASAPRYTTSTAGPQAKEAHIEVSLASDVVELGGALAGSVAFFNVDHNRYRGVRLTLVGREHLISKAGRARGKRRQRFTLDLPFEPKRDGEALPFRMKLPPNLVSDRRNRMWHLDWQLEVRARIGWGSDPTYEFPITLVPTGSGVVSPGDSPPAIGDERVRAIWEGVAERAGLMLDEDRMVGRRGEVDITIERDHRGAEGIFLTARLELDEDDELGLGLDGGVRTGFQRILGAGVPIGNDAFAKRHYFAGREDAQVSAFVDALLPRLRPLGVADASDRVFELEREGSGHESAALSDFAGAVLAVANAIGAARAAVPPPAAMTAGEASWRALAKRLDGRLRTADMAVRGEWEGISATVVTEWGPDDAPMVTLLRLSSPTPIDDEKRFVHDGASFVRGDPSKLSADAVALVTAIAEAGGRDLSVTAEDVSVSLEAPLLDAAPAERMFQRLASLLATLRGRVGPYR